ncbi:MAG TPA: S9 family peptidase [Anaeromyxobacteraceae bacterium]|nr:S9 family peptidase [Anaeromyxobacteraceae bacterium]
MTSRRAPLPPVLAAALALALPAAASSAAGPFGARDLVTLERLSDPQLSPDGSRLAFVVRSADLEANRGRTHIWIASADGTNPRQATAGADGESSPRWSPDGKALYFLAGRGGPAQVFRLRMDGGEGERVTSLPLDVGSFAISRDGRRLVVSAQVFPDCASDAAGALACTARRLDERAKSKATGHLYTRLPVRHWDEWLDGRRSHLFAVPIQGGPPVDLMRAMDADCPSRPFGGSEDYTFTPDGAGVVFSAKDAGREEAWSTNFDLFLVPTDGSAPPRNLTPRNLAWDAQPSFSPDGKTLVWLAMTVPGYEADRFRVMARAWPDGPEREVARGWDHSPDGTLAWSPDSKTVFATADSLGHHSLFAIDVASGAARVVERGGTVHGPSVAGGTVVFTREDFGAPADLYAANLDGTGLRRLTRWNAKALEGVAMGASEEFTFAGWNGEPVHAWVVKPPGLEPGRRVPVAFLIHGGPQGSWNDDFHYRWNPQVFAAAGYAAVMVDFHGSTGYGQRFTDSIGGDWGGKPLEDLQKGLAAALERYTWMDGTRVAGLGASFGGYMINWIEGAWPDRFRCLVSHDGDLDELHAYFDTEELWFPEREFGGVPWRVPQNYQRFNPVNLVKDWKTPILVVHGGRDFRVVETQGLATFTAAQRLGIPSEFLYFPDENHWVLKPLNSIRWHEVVLRWIDRFTKPGSS